MCGIVGVANHTRPAAYDLYYGLLAEQHRGKESAGMAVINSSGHIQIGGGMGELPQAFWGLAANQAGDPSDIIGSLDGCVGVGHVRYGTSGASTDINIQPIHGSFRGHEFAIAHNGNIINTSALRKMTSLSDGCSDTVVIANLLGKSPYQYFDEALVATVKQLEGAFSIVAVFNNSLYAIRDRFGFHPLQLGWRQGDWIVVSESCALDILGAQLVRDIYPGEFFVVSRKGQKTWCQWTDKTSLKFDLFEYIYFLRPDSIVQGVEAGDTRYRMGKFLAREHPVSADLVISVPDSGNEAARGYWQGMREQGFEQLDFHPWAPFRPHIVSRTFIEPVQSKRQEYLGLKFNPRPTQLKEKRVVVVDDSRVRGNTTAAIVRGLRSAGVYSIAMVVASPPYLFPDFYGIDTYRIKDELEAKIYRGSIKRMADKHGLAYLGYLSLEKTIKAVLTAQPNSYGVVQNIPSFAQLTAQSFYTGPFTGEYPAGTGDFSV